MPKNKDTEYDGWREPKIAMSFHRNRLKYYGVVWLIIIIFILLICIFSDIGGYVVGKSVGGKKLTKISQNKTISGSIGSFL